MLKFQCLCVTEMQSQPKKTANLYKNIFKRTFQVARMWHKSIERMIQEIENHRYRRETQEMESKQN